MGFMEFQSTGGLWLESPFSKRIILRIGETSGERIADLRFYCWEMLLICSDVFNDHSH